MTLVTGARLCGTPAWRGRVVTKERMMLSAALGCQFQEGDDLHSAENVEKMHGGTPLRDEDRMPWLHKIAEEIDSGRARGECRSRYSIASSQHCRNPRRTSIRSSSMLVARRRRLLRKSSVSSKSGTPMKAVLNLHRDWLRAGKPPQESDNDTAGQRDSELVWHR
jgi:carbohydrate kinase (thermoresistant glucokinase family)